MTASPPLSTLPAPEGRGFWSAIRDSLSGVQFDFTSGSLNRGIALLAIPMILEMAMESLFAVVDVYFVSRLGKEAVAAVGLTESMLTIMYAVAIGLSMSVTATVARRIGEGDRQGAAVAATQAIALGVLGGAVLGLPCAFLATDLLALMGASQAVQDIGSGYATLLLGANGVILLLFLHNAVFRGAGDPAIAMKSLWLANGLNIVLDPCLIFGLGPFPELGLTGAAVATTCGRGIGVLYQLWCLRRGKGRVHLRGKGFRIEWSAMWKLVRLSLGGIGQFLIATASWVVLVRIVAPFGEAALAGYTVGVRILMFAFLPAWGLSNAAATLVGQNLGAQKPERAERAVWRTGLYNMIFLGAVAVLLIAAPGTLVGFFTDEPDVQRFGEQCLRIIAYGYVFFAWGMVMIQAFNGAGDTVTPTWVNFFCFWLFEIPLALLLARALGIGPAGVFWAVAIAESAMAVVAIVLFRRGKWKLRTV